MRRADDVFFFTLIDFLVQVFFFGLLLFVLAQANKTEKEKQRGVEANQIEELKRAAGISNLSEITDYLTRLVPPKELKGLAEFMSSIGGVEKAKEAVKIVADAGGLAKIKENSEKVRKYEEGSGKRPCLADAVAGKKVVRPVATVMAKDFTIRFESNTPELDKVLQRLGLDYNGVRELPLVKFKQTFEPLGKIYPDCRFTLRFREATRMVYARDAARFTFYLNISKL